VSTVLNSRVDPSVSVCVPVFNEFESVPALLDRLTQVLLKIPRAQSGVPHELVLVDDGSGDATAESILENWPRGSGLSLRLVRFSRNFGHQSALTAALDHAKGEVCFLIDGDLQDKPEELPRFLALYLDGADVVFAQRVGRKEGLCLRLLYRTFYRVVQRLSDTPLPLDSGDFSLISRRVVDVMKTSPERNRYLRGLRAWAGFRQVAIPVERSARHAGHSKYNLLKLFRLAFDGIFSFSVVPLRFASISGLLMMAGAFLFGIYAVYVRFFLDRSPPGFTALTFMLISFSGLQLLFMGVMGEYLGRIYHEVKKRPHYVVDEVVELQ